MKEPEPEIYHQDESLMIETGIDGGKQESSWANGTLQGGYETTEFTIHTHLDVPSEILAAGDKPTAQYIYSILGSIHAGGLRFEVRIGDGGGAAREKGEL